MERYKKAEIEERYDPEFVCSNCSQDVESCDKCGEELADDVVYCNKRLHLCIDCYGKKKKKVLKGVKIRIKD